ncbi:MAG TPA: hypothetical protein VMV23_04965 [Candidatus Nanopelagicaceae bacterium]|nr:hypothetical protein [Candidatus Nanopelagicaceae bacterium]
MDTIGVRELQQHASAALRRVARGETLGITARGRLVAVLSAPSDSFGAAALIASGRVQQPRLGPEFLPEAELGLVGSAKVLEELRAERA